MTTRRFTDRELERFQRAKALGLRAGTEHRYTTVWFVVVERRVFVRSWNDKPTGWYRAFRKQPAGSITVAGEQARVQAVAVRTARLRGAVTAAFASRYDTKGSLKWVRGFAEANREATTLELVPAARPRGIGTGKQSTRTAPPARTRPAR